MPASADSQTQMISSSAATARAASAPPSSTRCGSASRSARSLRLAGSPSAPLATTIARPREPATARILMAVGNAPPPRPSSPARSISSINAPARSRSRLRPSPRTTGGGPCTAMCSSSVIAPSGGMPARSRGSAGGASGRAIGCSSLIIGSGELIAGSRASRRGSVRAEMTACRSAAPIRSRGDRPAATAPETARRRPPRRRLRRAARRSRASC